MWFAFNLYLWLISNNFPFNFSPVSALWFAFNLYLWLISNNCLVHPLMPNLVVICFQFVSLAYIQQRHSPTIYHVRQLWFAFNLYLWLISNNFDLNNLDALIVVICFQFVSLAYIQQPNNWQNVYNESCDLLSICIFGLYPTTDIEIENDNYELWFAFNLYLWLISNNCILDRFVGLAVVICFQFVSLAYIQQPLVNFNHWIYSCDLLSICIFGLYPTTLSNHRLYFV